MSTVNILYIVPSLNQADGISSYAMNYFRNIKNVNIDFLITSTFEKTNYCNEVISKGRKIYYIKSNEFKKILSTFKQIKKFFKENAKKYDIVHCHVASLGLPYLYYAKKYKIKCRILHAHATISADTFLHRIRNDITSFFTKRNATNFVACSNAAGKALFGKREFFVIKNGIEVSKYIYNEKIRNELKSSMNIDKKIVIGNVGRLSYQKNQKFLIDVAKELIKKTDKFIFMIIGNGELELELKEKIKSEKLRKNFIFLGKRNDVTKLYNVMDLFVLPSLFEGLPIVGIEAQANGLKCIFSNNITKEVNLSEKSIFLNIDKKDSANIWAKKILENKKYRRLKVNLKEYDIKNCAIELENYYKKIINHY